MVDRQMGKPQNMNTTIITPSQYSGGTVQMRSAPMALPTATGHGSHGDKMTGRLVTAARPLVSNQPITQFGTQSQNQPITQTQPRIGVTNQPMTQLVPQGQIHIQQNQQVKMVREISDLNEILLFCIT